MWITFQSGHNKGKQLMKKYECQFCGWQYDEATGAPDEGLAPGTLWKDVPDDWTCPDCGASKEDFDMVEV
jgi:rubredoxin